MMAGPSDAGSSGALHEPRVLFCSPQEETPRAFGWTALLLAQPHATTTMPAGMLAMRGAGMLGLPETKIMSAPALGSSSHVMQTDVLFHVWDGPSRVRMEHC